MQKTRKSLSMYYGLHPGAGINRLHAQGSKDERDLKQVAYAILSEQMALQEYVINKHLTERLLNAVWQCNKCHVSELDNDSMKKEMAKRLYPCVEKETITLPIISKNNLDH